jgi:hypothetical protein
MDALAKLRYRLGLRLAAVGGLEIGTCTENLILPAEATPHVADLQLAGETGIVSAAFLLIRGPEVTGQVTSVIVDAAAISAEMTIRTP